jgi:hypothetical protein
MIFISHSNADKRSARQVSFDLDQRGNHVWLDEGNIRAGSDLDDNILRAIESSTVFVYLATAESLASAWVQKELTHAMQCEVAVVPVLLGHGTLNDLPMPLRSMAALSLSRGRHLVATEIGRVEQAIAGKPPKKTQVWLRDDAGLEHSLDQLGRDGIAVESTHLLTVDWENLLEELYSSADPDLSWLNSSRDDMRVWQQWARNMPARVGRIAEFMPALAQDYVSANPDEPEGRFLRGATEESILVLIRQLSKSLAILRHLQAPDVADETERTAMMAQPPGPFPGGRAVDIVWGRNQDHCIRAECPSYVRDIDLLRGMVRAESVVLDSDLGRMVGWSVAARSWTQSGVTDSRKLMLDDPWPNFSTVMIGPH